MYSGSENGSSLPDIPEDASRGSSVSSTLQKEYEELLKFAVVAPKLRVASDPYVKESPNRTVISAKADLVTETGDIPSRSVANYKIDGGKDRDLSESSKNTEVVSGDESDSTVTGDRPVARSIRNHNYQNGTQRVVFKDSTEVTRTGYTNQYKPPSALPMISSSGAKALEDLLKDGQQPTTGMYKVNISSTSSVQSSPASTIVESDPMVDQDLLRMEGLMDEWCLDLKRNVLAELSQNKMRLLEQHKMEMYQEKQRHAAEVRRLQNEIENLKELVHTFERSINQKDIVVTNLTNALQTQIIFNVLRSSQMNKKDKTEKLKTFSLWRLKHNDEKREEFTSKLARKHYEKSLEAKVWQGWRSVVESRWKQRVEKACQARAQEVCVKLTEDYEERLKGLQTLLEEARSEVARMHREREQYEETMKKAFMRGVCALNMEAMGMFHNSNQEDDTGTRAPNTQHSSTNGIAPWKIKAVLGVLRQSIGQ